MADAGGRRRWWALAALGISMLVVGLDLTVLNVALPTLARDLNASGGQLQWFADAYNLVLAAVLLPAGLLGDRFGAKRLLLAALVVFGAASVGCAYAGSAGGLIAARAGLGLGAAFLIPLALSVLTTLFPAEERRRAIAVIVTANTIGIPAGPIVGGWLLDHFWWGSVFLINVPLIAGALVAVALLVPDSRGSGRGRVDLAGVGASSLGLVALTYGVIEAGERGWGNPVTLATLAAAVVLGAGFVAWERRVSQPLVDLSLFRSAGFSWGTGLATVVSFTMFGLLFALPQYFQAVRGADALGTGLRLLPVIVGMTVGTQLATRLGRRLTTRATVTVGFVCLAVAVLVGTRSEVATSYGVTGAWLGLAGVGLGFVLPAVMDAALSTIEPARAGVGSALVLALRQVGGTIGVALLGTVESSVYRGRLDVTGLPAASAGVARRSASGAVALADRIGSPGVAASARHAFVGGMDAALWVCAGTAVAGVALAAAFMPNPVREPAAAAVTPEPAPRSGPRAAESGHEPQPAFE